MIEEIKAKIEEAIKRVQDYKDAQHNLDIPSLMFHNGTINGYMRVLDIIKEVENDKNNK